MVYGVRVLDHDEVEPAAAPGAAGCDAVFVAEGLEGEAVLLGGWLVVGEWGGRG